MKNNKGFSLVELIIVIAIMAILVGVMAPQLIKYIEKSKVSSDTQLADTVHSAILDAALDPEVVMDSTASAYIANGKSGDVSAFMGTTNKFTEAVQDILGCSATDLTASLRSNGASSISVELSTNQCTVLLPGTDSTGSKAGSPNIEVK